MQPIWIIASIAALICACVLYALSQTPLDRADSLRSGAGLFVALAGIMFLISFFPPV